MSDRQAKRWRKAFKKQINDSSQAALKHEIFRLARNRDILGLVAIGEALAIIVLLFITFR